MRIEEAKTLTETQRERIANLAAIAAEKLIVVELSEDETKVLMTDRGTGKRICASPVTDFSD